MLLRLARDVAGFKPARGLFEAVFNKPADRRGNSGFLTG
jgi:hypothetical protein